jgi:DNA polymerase-3 subunit beta
MQFSIQREALLKPLQQVVGVVERRQTLPVLANLLVKVGDNKLSLTGTDLEVEMVATADAESRFRRASCSTSSGRSPMVRGSMSN